jgi:hypothetical protein
MPNTTYTDNALLNAMHGKASYTAPSNLYVGLSTTTPTAGGTNVTEPSGGAYARVTVPSSSFGSASSGSITNTSTVNFTQATASWGTITYVVVYDASSAGNLLWYAPYSQVVPSGVTLSFSPGSMTSTLS